MILDGFVVARVLGEVLFGFGALFAIINPYGLAFVFLERTTGLNRTERAKLSRRIALNAFVVLVVSLFFGSAILGFFGISLPALRLAGGLVVAVAGWTMLNADPLPPDRAPAGPGSFDLARRMAFFPLTIPLTTGPGSIAAAIALGAGREGSLPDMLLSSIASLIVAALSALTIWHAYGRAEGMARLLGAEGTLVITRLSAFLLLCVGVEIMLTGASDWLRPLLATR
ncbi:MarC family protein [Falsiroseomonas oryziterrae]|uniref:MarC family protein n=1 Tax=Falsiroseomonas oryziterrae TaxID=2911368 RepID=UPI001F456088|nr:MarC family protein [Roseomonas sp. NPKOSM-4]